jgi:hypothetical protein
MSHRLQAVVCHFAGACIIHEHTGQRHEGIHPYRVRSSREHRGKPDVSVRRGDSLLSTNNLHSARSCNLPRAGRRGSRLCGSISRYCGRLDQVLPKNHATEDWIKQCRRTGPFCVGQPTFLMGVRTSRRVLPARIILRSFFRLFGTHDAPIGMSRNLAGTTIAGESAFPLPTGRLVHFWKACGPVLGNPA